MRRTGVALSGKAFQCPTNHSVMRGKREKETEGVIVAQQSDQISQPFETSALPCLCSDSNILAEWKRVDPVAEIYLLIDILIIGRYPGF